jgi:pyruvate formate lyase activating enzyme
MVIETTFWSIATDGRIQCDLCPRRCKLREGQRGHCFVRANEGGRIVLTTYGRSSGFCVDPIEKKPLNHYFPGSSVLSFGTAGCNLACRFCQNWDISKSRQMDTLMDEASPEDVARAAQSLGCTSVAFTYNDPVIFHEYAVDVARACKDLGVRSVAVTAGYVSPAPREKFYRHMDAVNVDLKAFSEDFYHRLTGAHLADVCETILYIAHETNVWLELTTLVIPGENDSDRELDQMTHWIREKVGADVPLHFTAFHPDWKMTNHPATPFATLKRARELARKNGLHHVYMGNVPDRDGQSTYCPQCGICLINREGYSISGWNVTADGRCKNCDSPVAGVFADKPGSWGSRRMPIRMADFRQ